MSKTRVIFTKRWHHISVAIAIAAVSYIAFAIKAAKIVHYVIATGMCLGFFLMADARFERSKDSRKDTRSKWLLGVLILIAAMVLNSFSEHLG